MDRITERRVFQDGAWWEFQTVLTHGIQRRVQEVVRGAILAQAGPVPDVGGDVTIDWTKVDFALANDTLVLAATVDWSYGPVTRETMDGVPEEQYGIVLGRLNELHRSRPLAVPGRESASQRGSPRRSSRGLPSPLSSLTRIFSLKRDGRLKS